MRSALRAAACAALVWACGSGESEKARPTAATPTPAATAEAESRAPVAPGSVRFRYRGGRVTLEANAASVPPLLERLAREVRFELQLEPGDWAPLSASFQDLPLAEALPRLIGNRDYTAQWRASADGDAPHLELLHIGAPSVAGVTAEDPKGRKLPPRTALHGEEKKSIAGMVAGSLARTLHDRPNRGESQEALIERLRDPSAQVRMDAAVELQPEGEGLRALRDLLANDPDPGVRAAATSALETADDPSAVQALLAALHDPDPGVVVEVLNSLEFAADEKVVPQITPLLQHSDPDVREAAQDAIDFLGE